MKKQKRNLVELKSEDLWEDDFQTTTASETSVEQKILNYVTRENKSK